MVSLKDLESVAEFSGTTISQTGIARKFLDASDVILVLEVLYQKERHPLSIQHIVSETGIWITSTLRICIKLEELGLIKVEHGRARLTSKGISFARDTLKLRPKKSHKCTYCSGFGIRSEKEHLRILTRIKKERKDSPLAIDEFFGQLPGMPETVISRIVLLTEMGDLDGKKIIFLGDDDLTSVSAALTGLPEQVTVFEIDIRFTHFIEKLSKKYDLNLKVINGDLRESLPLEAVGSQDVFFTEPNYVIPYMKLFISRGVEMLKKEPGKVGYFTMAPRIHTNEEKLELQGSLTEMGLIISHVFSFFNEYQFQGLMPTRDLSAKAIKRFFFDKNSGMGKSNLVRLVTTDMTQPKFSELGLLLKANEQS